MSRLIKLKLAPSTLVNRFMAVRNASDSHDDHHHTEDPAIFGRIGPAIYPPVKPEPFDALDPSHGVATYPEKFRGMPVEQNYGPNITMDYIPIPCQSYQQVYGELNKKFNLALLGSVVFLVLTTLLGIQMDIFGYSDWSNPESYRNRKAINARLDAEAAAKANEG